MVDSEKKDIRKIFIAISLIAFAFGLFFNYQELWMKENGLSVKTISTVFSLCSLLTVSTLFFFSNVIKRSRLKKFATVLILLDAISTFSLFILNNTGLKVLIKFIIMFEYVVNTEMLACVYPIMSQIKKSDKLYAKKNLAYEGCKNAGIIIAGFLLGKVVFSVNINYNFFCLVACILDIISFFIFFSIRYDKYITNKQDEEKSDDNHILREVKEYIKNDKISLRYLAASLFNQISFNCIFGLNLILLTEVIKLELKFAITLSTSLSIIAVVIGILVLHVFTSKNDYVNLSIKFGGRVIFYFISLVTNYRILFLICYIYGRLFSNSYDHISEAPYVNRVDKKYQFAFCNLKTMLQYLGKSIGIFICGFTITLGLRFNLFFALLFAVLELLLRFDILRLKKIETMS